MFYHGRFEKFHTKYKRYLVHKFNTIWRLKSINETKGRYLMKQITMNDGKRRSITHRICKLDRFPKIPSGKLSILFLPSNLQGNNTCTFTSNNNLLFSVYRNFYLFLDFMRLSS